MTYQPTTEYPRRRRVWPWVLIIAAAALFCAVGFSLLAATMSDDLAPADPTTPATFAPTTKAPVTLQPTTAPTGPQPTTQDPTPPTDGKPPAPPATIAGDDVVHVGEDVKAGTYRAAEPVSQGAFDLCMWTKSKDAEGADVIDLGVPTGGRPQVTLKSGQWFKSQGCPKWVAK